ncbi:hypothetical protein ACC754_44710, partial [Rhizobium johnstonii]
GSNVVTGGIDLSLAANMGVSAAVYASLTQLVYGDATAIAAAILTCALIGTVNAIAVVYAGDDVHDGQRGQQRHDAG